ncbi:MAG: archaemetzincin family Zn-dependent metalloprotease [Dehalococcoidia bacterium]|nr:archaemetzincin family Zn-dependent metalloprotease [Dehalococcoidia bacterium]MDD5495451.1 archaemetzincin family Zn-dependent metalloprotease [Dehalococcoidia bacterium]
MEITLQPAGEIDSDILNTLKTRLHSIFGCPVRINKPIPIPDEAYIRLRDQYLSDVFLDKLKPLNRKGHKLLGVTDAELFTHGLNFVFGQADQSSGVAVISLHLLRQEYYGLPQDTDLFAERAVKEAVHELGHTFGMGHCTDTSCVMSFSNSLSDTDFKKPLFCRRCQPQLML